MIWCWIFFEDIDSLCSIGMILGEKVDWSYAQTELLSKQGIDLKAEMAKRSVV